MFPLKSGNSRHHLFTRPEIRVKLVQIYGEPSTPEDVDWLRREVNRVHAHIPVYPINAEFHRGLHKAESAPRAKKPSAKKAVVKPPQPKYTSKPVSAQHVFTLYPECDCAFDHGELIKHCWFCGVRLVRDSLSDATHTRRVKCKQCLWEKGGRTVEQFRIACGLVRETNQWLFWGEREETQNPTLSK